MINWIKMFWERGTKGYCYCDLWSFDNWLSKVIASGLREFKSKTTTYPNDIDNWEEWLSILDEMIECFEEQPRDINNFEGDFLVTYDRRVAIKKTKLHRGLELLEKYYYDLWD
uniref:Uncharacterized protein n=1 Tax=viral metagenome TaxID=1070528 RepID=A0A6M3KZI9_9ZZZZ